MGKDILFYLQNYGFVLVVSILVSTPIFPFLKKKISSFGQAAKKVSYAISAVILLILFVVAISYMVSDTYNPFLYFRF